MKVSLKWLNQYVDVPSDLKAFCDRLDLTGTGVEGVDKIGDTFENIVTAKVLEKGLHDQEVEAARCDQLWHELLRA